MFSYQQLRNKVSLEVYQQIDKKNVMQQKNKILFRIKNENYNHDICNKIDRTGIKYLKWYESDLQRQGKSSPIYKT